MSKEEMKATRLQEAAAAEAGVKVAGEKEAKRCSSA